MTDHQAVAIMAAILRRDLSAESAVSQANLLLKLVHQKGLDYVK